MNVYYDCRYSEILPPDYFKSVSSDVAAVLIGPGYTEDRNVTGTLYILTSEIKALGATSRWDSAISAHPNCWAVVKLCSTEPGTHKCSKTSANE